MGLWSVMNGGAWARSVHHTNVRLLMPLSMDRLLSPMKDARCMIRVYETWKDGTSSVYKIWLEKDGCILHTPGR
jgi:hypothetical protein